MTSLQLKEYCEAEFENIEDILRELEVVANPGKLIYAIADLAAIGTFMHHCYNGYENILKTICTALNIHIITSSTWQKDLLNESLIHEIITQQIHIKMMELLSFRHYFIHGYSLDLKWDNMEPLVVGLPSLHRSLKKEINQYINSLL
jgi:hypothetical protein